MGINAGIKETYHHLSKEREVLQAKMDEINRQLKLNAEKCTHPNREEPTTTEYSIQCPDCGDVIYCYRWC